jgi:methionine synthase I (cobalamin-dependent)
VRDDRRSGATASLVCRKLDMTGRAETARQTGPPAGSGHPHDDWEVPTMADIALRLGTDVLVLQGMPDVTLRSQGFDEVMPALNLSEPETVADMHALYRAAGADVAVTNTAGATSDRLSDSGLAGVTAQVNAQGVRLARGAGYPHVLARMTPCKHAAGDGDDASSALVTRELYAEQAEALASADPDALLVSGFPTARAALPALAAARAAAGVPVIVTLRLAQDTLEGASGWASAARALEGAGATALGVEGMGVEASTKALQAIAGACDLPLVAIPDLDVPAHLPSPARRDRLADQAARAAQALAQAGACLIGLGAGSSPAACGAVFAEVGGTRVRR